MRPSAAARSARSRRRRLEPATSWSWSTSAWSRLMASRLANRLPPQVEVSESISVGVIGLIDAAGRFKPSLGVPFSAFARRRIQGRCSTRCASSTGRRAPCASCAATSTARSAQLRRDPRREPDGRRDRARAGRHGSGIRQACSTSCAAPSSRPSARPVTDGRPLDARGGDRTDEGPHARLERQELRELLARPSATCPTANAKSWRSTTRKS